MSPDLFPARTALLVIDLQNDFLHARGAYARGGLAQPALAALPAMVAPLASALRAAGGCVAASRFTLWPDAGGQPIVSPHLRRLRPFLAAGDFAPASWGQQVVDELSPDVDFCVDKVAYSAFLHTQLEWVLRHRGVSCVLVCGIVTNGGVASSARDAFAREFDTVVLADACGAFRRESHEAALADLASVAAVDTCAGAAKRLGLDLGLTLASRPL
jgi:nicotinamidase-related amidase